MGEKISYTGKFCYSHDGESYSSVLYDTFEEAKAEALADANHAWVGVCLDPEVLAFIDAGLVIENIQCQDEWCCDAAETSLDCSREQIDELTEMFRDSMQKWLDKHHLWPTFYLVDQIVEVSSEEEISDG